MHIFRFGDFARQTFVKKWVYDKLFQITDDIQTQWLHFITHYTQIHQAQNQFLHKHVRY